jgi:uncharacterized phage protein (TIGR01671 family)
MRELKFRVWDNQNNNWLINQRIEDYPVELLYSDHKFYIAHSLDNLDNYIIQQYTGLKDKNGVFIYEGDIVKATSDQYTNENFVGKVIFDEGCFLTWINKNDIRGIWGEDDIEVIGNIFENGELLEK